ncbi:MAG: hypothetical protein IAE95_14835 [Chitinophagaceae bacterium]|nr:hypothetical protein [Chitinophagaceae bacterium]
MSFSVFPTERFKKDAKRLVKKYPSLKHELAELSHMLSIHPESGTPLGNDTFKIRIAIKSKNKGKSGGARVITYVVSGDREVYLLTMYDKADFESIDEKILKGIISGIR